MELDDKLENDGKQYANTTTGEKSLYRADGSYIGMANLVPLSDFSALKGGLFNV